VIERARGLSASRLEAIADLERRVVTHDGGRLKLEWGSLRRRAADVVSDLLVCEDGRLIGFAGLYGVHGTTGEIAGMVDPGHRRRGIAAALLGEMLELCRERGVREALLIVPRASAAGRALAERRGATLDHSEYALLLSGEPADGPSDPSISLRTAQTTDVATLLRLFTSGFGYAPADLAERLVADGARTVVAERDGRVLATARLHRDGDRGSIYGFVVDPPLQGQGIGRDMLRRICRGLREEGCTEVALEVEADNDGALHLYTSLGFAPVTTEDYWALRP
jgi:ribosomal protein S18 acetylase RimI-like enzyme